MYVESTQARYKRQQELQERDKEMFKKRCALCERKFSKQCLETAVMMKHVHSLRASATMSAPLYGFDNDLSASRKVSSVTDNDDDDDSRGAIQVEGGLSKSDPTLGIQKSNGGSSLNNKQYKSHTFGGLGIAMGGMKEAAPGSRSALSTGREIVHAFGSFDLNSTMSAGSDTDSVSVMSPCGNRSISTSQAGSPRHIKQSVFPIDSHGNVNQAAGASMYNIVNVCLFCSQFFDVDAPGGISPPTREIDRHTNEGSAPGSSTDNDGGRLDRYFDHRYPVSTSSQHFLRDKNTTDKRNFAKAAIDVATQIKAEIANKALQEARLQLSS